MWISIASIKIGSRIGTRQIDTDTMSIRDIEKQEISSADLERYDNVMDCGCDDENARCTAIGECREGIVIAECTGRIMFIGSSSMILKNPALLKIRIDSIWIHLTNVVKAGSMRMKYKSAYLEGIGYTEKIPYMDARQQFDRIKAIITKRKMLGVSCEYTDHWNIEPVDGIVEIPGFFGCISRTDVSGKILKKVITGKDIRIAPFKCITAVTDELVIDESCEFISDYAFIRCYAKRITIAEGIKHIGMSVFNCAAKKIEAPIRIPRSVESAGKPLSGKDILDVVATSIFPVTIEVASERLEYFSITEGKYMDIITVKAYD